MRELCIEDGCDRPALSRDMCSKHYQRWYDSTPPAERPPRPRRGLTVLERFYSYVNKMGPVARNRPDLGRCHVWTGGATRGYGIFWAEGTSHRAHVFIYKKTVGPVPGGLTLDHFACDRTNCVNPAHVRPVTHRENNLRSGNWAASNAEKMKCPRGHDYDEANTRVNKDGARECIPCRRKQNRERKREARAAKSGYRPIHPGDTRCPRDHELTPETLYAYRTGTLLCRTCISEKAQAAQEAKRAAKATQPPLL
jgi:hypothetical protein